MKNTKNKIYIVLMMLSLVLLLTYVSYAFFNYTRTGTNNTIRVGRISFISKNEKTITLNNLFPIDPSEEGIMEDNSKVGTYEIEITGDTDYSDGVEYLISVVDANIYTNTGQPVPISLDFTINNGLGTSDDNYFVSRELKNANIYKKLAGDTLVGNQMLLVGYIKPNTSSSSVEGIDGKITIKAYLDKNNIIISDTYDGTESDDMGTTNELVNGRTVFTTEEWNDLKTSGISFKVKVEANEGIWVIGSLEEIMKKTTVLDNINSTFVNNDTPGIDFGKISSDTNGKGVYTRFGTENNNYPIMYYRGAVEDNNVIFADKCWKTVRTTDTGGVKLLYNGLPGNVYERITIPRSYYDIIEENTDSRWLFDSNDNSWNIEINDKTNSEIQFHLPNSDRYDYSIYATTAPNCGGRFTLFKNNQFQLSILKKDGEPAIGTTSIENVTSSDIIRFTYSDSSTGTCSINIKISFIGDGDKTSDYGCDNSLTKSIIPNNDGSYGVVYNNSHNSPAYVGYMYGDVYEADYSDWVNNARFARDYIWDGTKYILVDDSVTTPDDTHHYSCNITTTNGTCSELRYVYNMSYVYTMGRTGYYYIILTDGDGIDDALNKMLSNKHNSIIKDFVESWYANNMQSYTNMLEDTIWCNDRSIISRKGWDPIGTIEYDGTPTITFGAYGRSDSINHHFVGTHQPTFSCQRKVDSFTWKNSWGNRKLAYPVALLTEDEIVFAGNIPEEDNKSNYIQSITWTMTPSFYGPSGYASAYIIDGESLTTMYEVDFGYGVSPAISLKPSQLIKSGVGTVNDPYIIN